MLDALPARGGMATTRIAQRADLPPTTVVRRLAALAAQGLIERCDEDWRLSRADRAVGGETAGRRRESLAAAAVVVGLPVAPAGCHRGFRTG